MEMLRTEAMVTKYVIIVPKNGQLKYVGRDYNPRHDYGYSVKVNRAIEFNTPDAASRAMENFGLHGCIGKIEKHTELTEIMECENISIESVKQFGPIKTEYTEKEIECEYASFLWSRSRGRYEQVNRAVQTEQMCRNRLQEYISKGWLNEDYDTSKAVFKKRLVSTLCTEWEEVKEVKDNGK